MLTSSDALVYPLTSPSLEEHNEGGLFFENDIGEGNNSLYKVVMILPDPEDFPHKIIDDFRDLGLTKAKIAKILNAKRGKIQWRVFD